MGVSRWRYPSPGLPLPVPAQERARETVRAAVEATVELLDQHPEREVTLAAIRERSGVSQGSLSHHFGSRDGLIAAANVERYARSCASDTVFLARFEGAVSAPEPFAHVMLGLIDDVLTPERREARWLRIAAVAAGLGSDELLASLRHSSTVLIDRMVALVTESIEHGVIHPDVDPRTLAVLSTMQAQGLVLDDLAGDDTPPSGWKYFQARFVGCFMPEVPARILADTAQAMHGDLWRAEIVGPPGRVPAGAGRRLAALRARTGGTVADVMDPDHVRTLLGEYVVAPLPTAAERLLGLAIEHVRTHGARGLDVEQLRGLSSVSANSTFHRSFDGHGGLLRAARHAIEIEHATASLSRFAQLIAAVDTPAELRMRLEEWGGSLIDPDRRHTVFRRAETIAATRTDLELQGLLGRMLRTSRDLLLEQVCVAQGRGLIDPSLPPAAVARCLDGAGMWHLLHELDEHRSGRDEWVGMLRRIAVLLSPDR